MPLLKIDKLNLTIHGTPILHDISVEMEHGEILGVVGESGSGKSLTAYSVMQLLPQGSHTSGSIRFDGRKLHEADEAVMCGLRGKEIGMIFQEPMTALNPVMTIGDQVAEVVQIHNDVSRQTAIEIASNALTRAELPVDRFPPTRFPHELSGGQRQRVMIAMAIATNPKLIIADEPTTALDVTTQAQILELLKRLVKEDDMGLMLITHDLAVVSELADQMVIMKDGRIVERLETGNLADINHPYTKQLFRASGHVPERTHGDQISPKAPLLVVENVSRDYQKHRTSLFSKPEIFRAVDQVSFSIDHGESGGLVGESGCGKSTLMRTILGLDPISQGSIAINGRKLEGKSDFDRIARRAVQAVFQDPYGSFNPRHKVARLVAEPMHLLAGTPGKQERNEAVEQALLSVGLEAKDSEKYIHEFSGGQRQRIAIARALIIKPELIVLDEATSALDVSIRAQILDLLAELSDNFNLSYLFIAHDLSVVRSITDRVLVMKNGKIVEQGETDSVFDSPQHPYTSELLKAAPKLPSLSGIMNGDNFMEEISNEA